MKDQIDQYTRARIAILQHKHDLEQQLGQIEAALDDAKVSRRPRTSQNRQYGELTSAVSEVLARGSLTKREIVKRLREQKFNFGGPPLKILDSVIYTPHFLRSGKLFSVAGKAKPVEIPAPAAGT